MADLKEQETVNETPELVAESLKATRVELSEALEDVPQPEHLPQINAETISDKLLIRFLRCQKFKPQKAAKLYLKYRIRKAELFPDEVVDTDAAPTIDNAIRNTLGHGMIEFTANHDKYKRRILLMHFKNMDYSSDYVSPEQMARAAFYLMDRELALDEDFQKFGVCMVALMQDSSRKNFNRHTPKLMLDNIQNCLPVRVGRMLFTHQPFFFGLLFKVVKLFMKEKMRQRIVMIGTDHDLLLNYIDKKYIPESLDGEYKVDVSGYIAKLG